MAEFIISNGPEHEIKSVLGAREVEYYRYQANIYFIKVFNKETGEKRLYEEQMFERERYKDLCSVRSRQ